jgi:hypothetical protein
VNPFDPALACGLEKVYQKKGDAKAARAAAACRALGGD